jgi:diaminopimelate decarboxylase
VRRALSALGNDARSELAIGGIPTSELIQTFGSPLYAFDGDALRMRAREVRAAFGPSLRILYSIKANPSVALTSILRDEGCGAEIASLGELITPSAISIHT